MRNYSDWLIDCDYVFNSSPLDYNRWDQLKSDFYINKKLVNTVIKVVDKEIDSVGNQTLGIYPITLEHFNQEQVLTSSDYMTIL